MADEETVEVAEPKKAGKSRMIILLAGLLIGEAGLIVGAMTMLAREPEVAVGVPEVDPAVAEEERLVEVLVLDAKLPNARRGVTYLFDTEIYVQTKKKHEAQVQEIATSRAGELRAEIQAIWKAADPRDFEEPRAETLTRKVNALLGEWLRDGDGQGSTMVEKCVVVMGTGFRVDS